MSEDKHSDDVESKYIRSPYVDLLREYPSMQMATSKEIFQKYFQVGEPISIHEWEQGMPTLQEWLDGQEK